MDNISRFRNFARFETDIAQFGQTVQEIALQKGQPDPDPVVSPMADPRFSTERLGLHSVSASDRMRLRDPSSEDLYDDFVGFRKTFVEMRGTLRKLNSRVVKQLLAVVRESTDERRQLKEDSLGRVFAATKLLTFVQFMAEDVASKVSAASKA